MTDRYKKTPIFQNDSDIYKPLFEIRELKYIKHYAMGGLKYPTDKEISELDVQKEVWKLGDAYWKYAHQYYDGRSQYWWVIAQFNKKPTEHHCIIGETIYIPLPLDKILRSYGL